jgi:hypothetical protein
MIKSQQKGRGEETPILPQNVFPCKKNDYEKNGAKIFREMLNAISSECFNFFLQNTVILYM